MHPCIKAAALAWAKVYTRGKTVDEAWEASAKAAVLAALRHESVRGADAVRQGVIDEIIAEIEAAP